MSGGGHFDSAGGHVFNGGGSGGGVAFDVGVQVPSGDVNALLYVDSSGNLQTSSDDNVIGATGVRLGYLLYAEHIADHVYLGHVDANTSSSIFQIDLQQDGDVIIKAPTASGAVALIGGISGTGAINMFVNLSTLRLQLTNVGIGFFAATPVAKQVGPVLNLTNSIASGGTDGTFTNWTDLSVYATDAAAIRNAVYQLARSVKFCSDALRAYGLLT